MAPGRTARIQRVLATVIAIALSWLALAFAASPAASAHATLIGSDPASGAQLDSAPAQLELRFDQPVTVRAGGVRVLDALGRPVHRGRARATGDGVVRVALAPDLGRGGYVAAWQVVSEDGHPLRGTLTFTVGDADAGVLNRLARRLLDESATSRAVSATTLAGRIATAIGLATALGSVVWAIGARRGRSEGRAVVRAGVGGAALASFGAVAQLAALGPTISGDGLGSALDPSLVHAALATRTGRLLLTATVLSAVLAALLGARWTRPGSGVHASDVGVAIVALLATAAVAGSGHGGSGPLPGLAWPAQTAHVAAAGAWAGLLVVLVGGIVLPAQRGSLGGRAAAARASRISTLIGTAVAVTVATGAFATWRQVRSIDGLRDTSYGSALVVKLVLVGSMLALGWWNRRSLGRTGSASMLPRRLGAFARVEIAASVLVLALSAVVAQRVPPREALGAPQVATIRVAGLDVEVTLDRRGPGRNELHLIVTDPNGQRTEPTSIAASAWLDAEGIGPLDIVLRTAGDGHRVATPRFDVVGSWRIELVVAVDEFSEERGSVSFAIG